MIDPRNLEQFAIYEVDSPCFRYAIYDGAGEMVGVRLKWGRRYLFGEHIGGPGVGIRAIGERVDILPESWQDGTPIRAGLFEIGSGSPREKWLLDWFIEWELTRNRQHSDKVR